MSACVVQTATCKHAIQLINALQGHAGVIMPLGAVLQQSSGRSFGTSRCQTAPTKAAVLRGLPDYKRTAAGNTHQEKSKFSSFALFHEEFMCKYHMIFYTIHFP